VRSVQRTSASGGAWTALSVVEREAGVRLVGLVALAAGLSLGSEVVVRLQGTVLHPDATDAAWVELWSGTLTSSTPAAGSVATPVYVGAATWLRWTLSTPAPVGASVQLALASE